MSIVDSFGYPVGVLIIDTDIGTDPDDAVALAVAARAVPDLALVLTNDEADGERARLARHLLDLLGRPDVPVVAGASLPGTPPMVISAPPSVPAQPGSPLDAVAKVTAGRSAVRWLGIGAMTNLAAVLTVPETRSRLRIVQMGGALNYRNPDRAEHNVRRDPAAVATVLRLADVRPSFVMSDHTFRPEIGIGPDSPFYRHWRRPDATAWQRLLADHHDGFFARFHPESLEHDPLTLSAVVGEPFVAFTDAAIVIDYKGRMRLEPDGHPVRLSQSVDYDGFLRWLAGWVGPTPRVDA
jgi:pyrimidine-specific ribonucleoside hydrolase